jgi:hypothetical protein
VAVAIKVLLTSEWTRQMPTSDFVFLSTYWKYWRTASPRFKLTCKVSFLAQTTPKPWSLTRGYSENSSSLDYTTALESTPSSESESECEGDVGVVSSQVSRPERTSLNDLKSYQRARWECSHQKSDFVFCVTHVLMIPHGTVHMNDSNTWWVGRVSGQNRLRAKRF